MANSSGVFLAIEGGGSKGRAAIAWDGRIIARSLPVGLNPNDIGRAVLRRRLRSLIEPLLEAPGVPAETIRVRAALAGAGRPGPRERCISGLKAVLRPHCSRLTVNVSSDAEALLGVFFRKRDGLVLIAGTGSICVGVKHRGRKPVTARAGGWGSYLDSGSGFRLGFQVLEAALEALDGRGETTAMVGLLCRRYGLRLDGVPGYFLPPCRERVAGLARVALEAASEGDPAARRLAREAAADLVGMVCAVADRLGLARAVKTGLGTPRPFDLVISGGLFESPYLSSLLERILRRRIPSASIIRVADPLACLIS